MSITDFEVKLPEILCDLKLDVTKISHNKEADLIHIYFSNSLLERLSKVKLPPHM